MLYVIHDTLLKVGSTAINLTTKLYNVRYTSHSTICQLSCITWWPVLLVLNTTSNNVSGITYNMVTSIIGVEHHFQQHVIYNMVTSHSTPIKLSTMLYVIPDTLLEMVFNTNNTGHHVIRWHIVGSGVQHQKYWSPCYTFICTTHYWRWCSTPIITPLPTICQRITWWPVFLVLNTTSNNMSAYNMVTSIIGVEHHFQQYVNV
jgi:hypothetical protein